MKKYLTLITLTIISCAAAFSQEKCASQILLNIERQKDPTIWLGEELNGNLLTYLKANASPSVSTYSVPIVVQVEHDYGAENIPNSQIINAIQQLNEDFNAYNSDTAQVIIPFKSIIGNASIRFIFARIDPAGNCTNGIVRIPDETTYNGYGHSTYWPQNKYLNFFVVNNITGGSAGYSSFSFGSPPYNNHAITIQHTAFNAFSRTPTHEAGHYFGLLHIWDGSNQCGVSCNGNDLVGDTPQTIGYFNCPTPNAAQTCTPGIQENYQNFMDYTNCGRMFTQGQVNRMHNQITLNNGLRGSLTTNSTAIATGIHLPMQTCKPNVDFTPGYGIIMCAGDSVQYKDLSYGSDPTSWQWSFPGGTPSTSTLQNVWVKYNAPGTYSATLNASNSAGSSVLTKTNIVTVFNSSLTMSLPYFEGFENNSSFQTDWYVFSKRNNKWNQSGIAAKTGTGCAVIQNFTSSNNEVDKLISPQINLAGSINPKLTFARSYVRVNTSTNDKLSILYSTDCGKTWNNTGYLKSGVLLATAPSQTNNFIPNSPTQWDIDTLDLTPIANQPNVRFMFNIESEKGNNLFIDDINITHSAVGVEEKMKPIQNITVFPNPANSQITISFISPVFNEAKIELIDVVGKIVWSQDNQLINVGKNEIEINSRQQQSGVYFVKTTLGTSEYYNKIIIMK